jgi:hypothetical protein
METSSKELEGNIITNICGLDKNKIQLIKTELKV